MKQVIVKAALMAVQMGLTMMNKTEGPRLESLEVTTADFGTPLNYIWGTRRLEGCPIIWAEKLKEKKNTSKGKGGKYAEYKYFGTFAVAVCDHEIDAVSRIWMDKHLVYDVTKAGPISSVIGLFSSVISDAPVKITNGRNMRIYKGTETQEPDPRMEAWCEDRYGADSCPAYRGVSYIVFQDLPLEKFGNRIPQVTVEAVNNSSNNFLFETITPGASIGPVFSPDGSRALFYNTANEVYAMWDVPSRTKIIQGVFPAHAESVQFSGDGTLWGLGGALGSILRAFTADGQALLSEFTLGVNTEGLTPIGDYIYLRPYAGAGTTIYQATAAAIIGIDVSFGPSGFLEDLDGHAWAVGIDGTTVHLYDIVNATDHTFSTPGGITGGVTAFMNSDGNFVVFVGANAVLVDSDAETVLDSIALPSTIVNGTRSGSSRFYTNSQEIDANTLEVIKTFSLASWTTGNTDEQRLDVINHALWGFTSGSGTRTIRYLDRIGSSGTDLADVIQDVADRCGVVELDVSGLTQTVTGYSVVQGPGKDWIAPLLDIHDVDARPHDFAVQFLTRGSSAAGTINVTEFVREGDEPRYAVTIKQDTDLPRRVGLSFADANKDQQKNTVLSQRPLDGTDGDRELTIDLSTYVATPGDAQKFADRFFRRKWNGREQVANALTAQYLGLEPGDVWNLQLDDVTQSHKLVKATISQGRINTEWERDFPGLNTLGTGAGAVMDGRDDDEIYVPSQTKGFVLDIPLTQDSHELAVPQLHYAAGAYAGDWPGAVAYEVETDGDYVAWNAIDSVDKAVWGYSTDALANANPNVWDRGNSVNVLAFGTLTSSTEAAINANPLVNLALLGNELFNFTTATLEADGTYTLSGLKRGRRGTEWACNDHAIGDEFVMVEDMQREGLGLSDVGVDFTFKVQTLARDVDSAPPIDLTFAGNSLKPYAPARVKQYFDGTDLILTVIRRTRIGGAWTGGSTIPLSEDAEEYEIEIYSGATLKRTLTLTGTNAVTYTAAQMTTDFGSAQTSVSLKAYQISAAVDRGFELAA